MTPQTTQHQQTIRTPLSVFVRVSMCLFVSPCIRLCVSLCLFVSSYVFICSFSSVVYVISISRFDMSCAQAHWIGSNRSHRVVPLNLQKPTMAIGHSLRMCTRHVDSNNPGRSNQCI